MEAACQDPSETTVMVISDETCRRGDGLPWGVPTSCWPNVIRAFPFNTPRFVQDCERETRGAAEQQQLKGAAGVLCLKQFLRCTQLGLNVAELVEVLMAHLNRVLSETIQTRQCNRYFSPARTTSYLPRRYPCVLGPDF